MDSNHNDAKHSATVSIPADTWLHTRETITLLYLAICQIETSIEESNQSVQQLTNTFTELARQTLDITPQCDVENAATTDMRQRINEGITAFQFYDRISQRLDHVAKGLERMTELFSDVERLENPDCWKQIQAEVQASHSMECERAMFEKILEGATVAEALATYKAVIASEQQKNNDDVELF